MLKNTNPQTWYTVWLILLKIHIKGCNSIQTCWHHADNSHISI